MGSQVVEEPLYLRWSSGKPVPPDQHAKSREGITVNALAGMGLWMLLWLGYNTNYDYATDPNFPASTLDFIHGIRAFFPIAAAWIACLMIVARLNRLLPWLLGPLGLLLLYTVVGLASSATLSLYPVYALYYGANYLATVLVLLAIVLVDDPLADLRKVLRSTWIVGIVITLSLLGAIPFLGSAAIAPEQAGPVAVRAYVKVNDFMDMAGTRNTGFARYAGISALVALPALLRKGSLFVRMLWAIVFGASLYALIIANGRTETLALVCGVFTIMIAERKKRTANLLIAMAGAILLALRGFFSAFYLYVTRTGHVDFTLTGRVAVWGKGWRLVQNSPWVGFGFMADRFMTGQHMHNAFLHAFIQSGLIGGTAILLALSITAYYIVKYFIVSPPADRSLVPQEIPAVFLFVVISSFMESTFAYFSAAWLLSAPIVAYVLALHLHLRRARAKAAWEKLLRWRLMQSGLSAIPDGERITEVLPRAARGSRL